MTNNNENLERQENHVRIAESIVNTNRWSTLQGDLEHTEIYMDKFTTPRQKEVFLRLLFALRTEYDSIKHDYYENKYTSRSLLAWRARNLLEINTWCRFCCEDIANAETLFKWAGEDQLELENQLEKWGKITNQPPQWFETIERTKQDILDQAEKRGISDLEAKYKNLSEVAKKFGHEKTFQVHNKILSKFAHPTPMAMLSEELGDGMQKRAFYFFSQGCILFYDAFSRLENFINENDT